MATKTALDRSLAKIGDQGYFLLSVLKNLNLRDLDGNEFMSQCYSIGYKSFGIIAVTGFVLGFVLTLQTLPTLKGFGAESYVPSMVSISMIREIGPVITALICAGKISSGIGAELGSMKVTEQIDAMEISGANAIQYLVTTRILACILMIPLLTLVADGMAFIGGFAGINITIGMNGILYFQKSFFALQFSDILPAIIKTFFFGFIIGFIGCYKGYKSGKGAESVGRAANAAVVSASIWIIILDAIAVELTNALVYR